jgi:NADPH-dependent 2,4-dienoyl-CoA reductase/sulfur reductase-like enzyme
VSGVVAAGDVAEAADWLTGERYVHAIFSNAVTQAPRAAANLLGGNLTHDGAEWMNKPQTPRGPDRGDRNHRSA